MSYIPFEKVVDGAPFETLTISVVAQDTTEIQIQVEKEYDDIFFDLNVEQSKALRDSLDEFIAGR